MSKNPDKCAGNCLLCTALPRNAGCNTKFTVYKYNCRLCSQEYVGYSARCIKYRHAEHRRSINKGDDVSALSTHLKNAHSSTTPHTIDLYEITLLQRCKDAIAACIAESYHIKHISPQINRKEEGCTMMYV